MTTTVLEPTLLAEAARASLVAEAVVAAAVRLAQLSEGPDDDRPGWSAEGDCVGMSADMFFPERGASSRDVRSLCSSCPVQAHCLAAALWNSEREGWWGGTSALGRRRLRKVLTMAGIPYRRRDLDADDIPVHWWAAVGA